MLEIVREAMIKTFPKLTPDEIDQAESMYENMQIAWEQMTADMEEEGKKHFIAPELHMFEICQLILHNAYMDAQQGFDSQAAVIDGLKYAFLFGYNIGKRGWNIEGRPCSEVH